VCVCGGGGGTVSLHTPRREEAMPRLHSLDSLDLDAGDLKLHHWRCEACNGFKVKCGGRGARTKHNPTTRSTPHSPQHHHTHTQQHTTTYQ
jgi:hypothetical protein